jgi:hypothetical protein
MHIYFLLIIFDQTLGCAVVSLSDISRLGELMMQNGWNNSEDAVRRDSGQKARRPWQTPYVIVSADTVDNTNFPGGTPPKVSGVTDGPTLKISVPS